MPDVNSMIGRTFAPDARPSQAMAADRNSAMFSQWIDPNILRKPDSYVYIYTVSEREFKVELPPQLKRIHLPACQPGERYRMVCTLPQPFQQPDNDLNNGDIVARSHDARRVAMDIVNPNNTTLDQDAVIDAKYVLGYGNNLGNQGVFWSLNAPPAAGEPPSPELEAEIAKAVKRRERYYRGLLEKARTLELANPKELENELNMDYHMAADYFAQEFNWHKKMDRRADCPNCGERIKAGVAFHRNAELDIVCIIDPDRAARAGVFSAERRGPGRPPKVA